MSQRALELVRAPACFPLLLPPSSLDQSRCGGSRTVRFTLRTSYICKVRTFLNLCPWLSHFRRPSPIIAGPRSCGPFKSEAVCCHIDADGGGPAVASALSVPFACSFRCSPSSLPLPVLRFFSRWSPRCRPPIPQSPSSKVSPLLPTASILIRSSRRHRGCRDTERAGTHTGLNYYSQITLLVDGSELAAPPPEQRWCSRLLQPPLLPYDTTVKPTARGLEILPVNSEQLQA